MNHDNDTMRRAMRLMQAGDLQAATRTLQDALAGNAGPAPAAPAAHDARGDVAGRGACLEGEFRVIDDTKAHDARPPADHHAAADLRPGPTAGQPYTWPRSTTGEGATHAGVTPWRRPASGEGTGDGNFPRLRFSCAAGELEYGLYIPPGLETAGAPLLVMLHGCTQTPEDFARGTRMNQLADGHGYVVAWPAQSAERNQNRCWNWFRGSDQQRDRGEPAILAALTRHLVSTHGLDAGRVYVAGLSAGGAMAAVLASTHPDVYAAIGVHSGLPVGVARDMPSAFAAMRKGSGRRRRASFSTAAPVPAIVFHGDGDATVHPGNGLGVVEQSLDRAADDAGMTSAVERASAPGGRSATRTVHRTADGRIAAEHWVVHGAGHAWSGGDASGSYTDPQGPDASAEMLRFFAGCRRSGS
ncbi:extracellular catalytic domain type 1 short-chain-length polyhydroxyalkanoate depolymerase [Luteimonas yindakuii]|uniref:extracellular catalytic domain type 1 short-chain-length polyhydroxyalkanoate depolymerase n=1 Tax=Luteimonas yindakuii TaxID=2565782 RepID=UPI00141F86C4|nr:PHB depolymerase family esterase [Luteimonas yindakuii]